MPEILLIRHGLPRCDLRARIRGCDYAAWVVNYDSAPLDCTFQPPPQLQAMAHIPCIMTSALRRSIESASLIAPGRACQPDARFNEAAIPTTIRLPLKLPPFHWDVLARTVWFLGLVTCEESFSSATERATRAAARLTALGREHGTVALVGHGMLNTLINRELRRSGWRGKGSPRAYWGSVELWRE